jgi:xanthine dehydrogenase small subunit
MNTRPVRFFHRGALVEHAAPEPTRSVLQWLREEARCTGTKEGCNEGDCGACTVVLGELGADGQLQLKAVNSCIQFLPTLDGKALFTVEDLAAPGAPLHPVQQAMVDCHGSQCGFCTPGFVMSLWATRERHAAAGSTATRQEIADDLSGNLCRCTGYRPILDAGERACAVPGARLDAVPVVAVLRQLQADAPLATASGFFAPKTVDELAALLEARPTATLLAGSTDIGLWVNKQFRPLGDIVWLGAVAELQRIHEQDGQLVIGAGASLEAAWGALAARWPSLHELWLRFAGRPTREAGTMGGNVANGSPIGDSAPVLMALGATLVLQKGPRIRRPPLDNFYTGYMKNQREPGEFVRAIELPLPTAANSLWAYKISKRFDCDISALCGGFALTLDGERVADVRLAFGGMAAVVRRAAGAEAALRGARWDEATLQRAQQALDADFTPLSDLRASADYRRQAARGLLRRLWLETRPGDALPPAATSVWARGTADTATEAQP